MTTHVRCDIYDKSFYRLSSITDIRRHVWTSRGGHKGYYNRGDHSGSLTEVQGLTNHHRLCGKNTASQGKYNLQLFYYPMQTKFYVVYIGITLSVRLVCPNVL